MASKLKNLIATAFNSAETADVMSAYAETSIRVIQKSFADLILNGELSTEPILSIAGESNTLSFDALLPQVYHDKIDRVQKVEQTLKLEGLVGLSDSQKTMPKITIQCLGSITDHNCILSAFINPFLPSAATFLLQVFKSPVFHLIQSGLVNDHQTTPIPPN